MDLKLGSTIFIARYENILIVRGQKVDGEAQCANIIMASSSNFSNTPPMADVAPFLPCLPKTEFQVLHINWFYDVAVIAILNQDFHANEPKFQSAWFIQGPLTQMLVVLFIQTRLAHWKPASHRFVLIAALATVPAIIILFKSFGTKFGLVTPFASRILAVFGLIVAYLIALEGCKRALSCVELRRYSLRGKAYADD